MTAAERQRRYRERRRRHEIIVPVTIGEDEFEILHRFNLLDDNETEPEVIAGAVRLFMREAGQIVSKEKDEKSVTRNAELKKIEVIYSDEQYRKHR